AVVMSDEGVIREYHLPPTIHSAEEGRAIDAGNLQATLDNVEQQMLVEALEASAGNKAKAARILGITERVMGYRVKRLGIAPSRFRRAR
ncbi:MAG: helix-turn-helix domain-containing protein, partial [Planctomycetia bacterium]|nr:helix-turn-helix domain-containing protein [Planctomycetia bacterium]